MDDGGSGVIVCGAGGARFARWDLAGKGKRATQRLPTKAETICVGRAGNDQRQGSQFAGGNRERSRKRSSSGFRLEEMTNPAGSRIVR
jgi:hypothetical protein